jgi:hypothetical protein
MAPDDTARPGGDWSFPAVESASAPDRPADEAVDQQVDQPIDQAVDEPVDEPVAEPADAMPGAPPDPVRPPLVSRASSNAEPLTAVVPPPSARVPQSDAEEPPSEGVLPVPRRFPVTRPPISPLRAVAGAAVAVAGVLLGIGALLWATDAPKGSPALQQTQAQSSPAATSTSAAASPSADTVLATAAPLQTQPTAAPTGVPKLPLTVLNNSNVNQLAKRAAARFHAAGWPITLTGGFRGRISVTTVYYAPGQQASAFLLQKAFPAIQRVHPRFAGLPGSGLTVVLTRDYPG